MLIDFNLKNLLVFLTEIFKLTIYLHWAYIKQDIKGVGTIKDITIFAL